MRTHLKYPAVEIDHRDAGDVKRGYGGVDDEVCVVKDTLRIRGSFPHRGVILVDEEQRDADGR